MYPSDQLNRLSFRKRLLLSRSAELRCQCGTAAEAVWRPVSRVVAITLLVQTLTPILAMASFIMPSGKITRRIGVVGVALQWLPRFVRFAHAFSTSH